MNEHDKLLVQAVNKAVAELFGKTKRHGHGPLSDLFLFTVSWKDSDGQNKCKLFKRKRLAIDFYSKMKSEHDNEAGIFKGRYDCYMIYEDGVEDWYKENKIEDWSVEELKQYVEYHKNF